MRHALPLSFALIATLLLACSSSSSTSSADCGPPPPLHCIAGCGGGEVGAVCENGNWHCPPQSFACVADAAIQDGAPTDAGEDVFDAGPPGDGGVPCGTATCDARNDYCQNDNGGAVPPEGGSASSYTCTPIPAACDAGKSCACINTNGCQCTDNGGAITVTCNFP